MWNCVSLAQQFFNKQCKCGPNTGCNTLRMMNDVLFIYLINNNEHKKSKTKTKSNGNQTEQKHIAHLFELFFFFIFSLQSFFPFKCCFIFVCICLYAICSLFALRLIDSNIISFLVLKCILYRFSSLFI